MIPTKVLFANCLSHLKKLEAWLKGFLAERNLACYLPKFSALVMRSKFMHHNIRAATMCVHEKYVLRAVAARD